MDEKTKGDEGSWNPMSRRFFLVIGVMCWAVFCLVFFLIAMLFGGCINLADRERSDTGLHCASVRPPQCTSGAWSLAWSVLELKLLGGAHPAFIPTRTKGGTDV